MRGLFVSLLITASSALPLVAAAQSNAAGDAAFDRKDYAAAAALYAAGAEDGDKGRAWNRLGYLYLNGTGVAQSEQEAFKWFRKAADVGNPMAQNALGNAYRKGEGTAQNYAEALKWYRLAAQQGHSNGMNNLGYMHQNGWGVTRDHAEARRLFEQAAAKGNIYSQNNLGVMHRDGLGGLPRDRAEAAYWFRAALSNPVDDFDTRRGKPQARELLTKLEAAGPIPERKQGNAAAAPGASPSIALPGTGAQAPALTAAQGAQAQTDQLRRENEELRRRQLETEAQVAELMRRQQAAPAASAATTPRNAHALVLGNSAYAGSSRLPNPINDAKAMAAKLRGMGFTVTEVLDTTRVKLASALTAFSRTAARADLSLLFYAGHGVQVNGTNYMLPVDMDMNDVDSVVLQGISLNAVVEQYLPGDTKLVLLDACRDNPLVRTSARGVSRGLAPISVAKGTLIAYSTKDGATAEDGSGTRNSPFTEALLDHLGDPEDIAVVLRKVREQVLRKTNNRQEPWDYGALTGGSLVLSAVRGNRQP